MLICRRAAILRYYMMFERRQRYLPPYAAASMSALW